MAFWIYKSVTENKVWYVLRADNTEIKVRVKNNMIYPAEPLKIDEIVELEKHFLHKILESDDVNIDIIRLHLMGLSDTAIMDKLDLSYFLVQKVTTKYWEDKFIHKKNKNK